MRKIDLIIVHCSAVRPNQTSSVAQINAWHKKLGWKCIGYHYVIRRDGTVEKGRDEASIGAHCSGYNKFSIGVCYEGGLAMDGSPKDTRSDAQKASLLKLLKELKQRYPSAKIRGHCDFANKACPCFDATTEYKDL